MQKAIRRVVTCGPKTCSDSTWRQKNSQLEIILEEESTESKSAFRSLSYVK